MDWYGPQLGHGPVVAIRPISANFQFGCSTYQCRHPAKESKFLSTGYVYHEIYAWHDAGSVAGLLPSTPRSGLQPFHHLDTADNKRRLHELVAVSGLLDHLVRLQPVVATDEQLLTVHSEAYLDRLARQSDGNGGDAGDGISPFGAGGLDVMRRAAGGAISAISAVADQTVTNSYALIRPSGHHALADHGMGMTYLANVAIAVHHAKSRGVGRIAVVDWDAHHGNGTQAAFANDPAVLTISLHQDNCFPPGSGAVTDRGTGPARGTVINVPLPPGTGNGGYQRAFDQVVVPALHRFRPDLIVVASGLDSGAMDPLARMLLSSGGYRTLTRSILDAASALCDGRVCMIHEGGYSEVYVPFCGHAIIEELAGVHLLDDPYLELVNGFGGQELQPHQQGAIDQAVGLVADVPPPGQVGQ
jgi:acetoin utilization deacetylase AcuC-like enzyme